MGGSHIDCCLAMLHTCILKLEKQEKGNKTIFSISRGKKKTAKNLRIFCSEIFFFLITAYLGISFLKLSDVGPHLYRLLSRCLLSTEEEVSALCSSITDQKKWSWKDLSYMSTHKRIRDLRSIRVTVNGLNIQCIFYKMSGEVHVQNGK